jgi:hypothetical protein
MTTPDGGIGAIQYNAQEYGPGKNLEYLHVRSGICVR